MIFFILGLPFTKWGFKTDDWGNIWHSVSTSWRDWLNFFTEGKSIELFNHPSNCDIKNAEQSFFCGLYRPMSFIYFAPQYWFFKAWPYGYYLVTIATHALASVIFFNLLSFFTGVTIAFFSATYFGFHPSLWNWLGWTSAQTYQIELLVLLLIIVMLKSFIDKKNWWAYIFACFLFLTNVFLREQTIFLPFWLVFAIPLYQRMRFTQKQSYIWCFGRAIVNMIPFFCISFFYLLVRLHFFQFTANTATLTFQPTWQSFSARMISRKYDFVSYVADMLGLSVLPNNHQIIKGLLIIFLLGVIIYFFIRSKNKLVPFFLSVSCLLFSWPALLMHTQPRYYYMALPLFIALFLVLIRDYLLKKHIQIISFLIVTVLIVTNTFFLYAQLKKRERVLHHITTVFRELTQHQKTQNRALCFFNLPSVWFHEGTTQAVWLLRQSSKYPVFHYECSNIEEFSLPQSQQKYNPLFITWDQEKKNFIIMDRHD